jgi:hypothetical protein
MIALPIMSDIRGASQAENPLGVPRFRSVTRVATVQEVCDEIDLRSDLHRTRRFSIEQT